MLRYWNSHVTTRGDFCNDPWRAGRGEWWARWCLRGSGKRQEGVISILNWKIIPGYRLVCPSGESLGLGHLPYFKHSHQLSLNFLISRINKTSNINNDSQNISNLIVPIKVTKRDEIYICNVKYQRCWIFFLQISEINWIKINKFDNVKTRRDSQIQ